MKKKLYMLITILCMVLTIFPLSTLALAKKEVKLSKCVDGDTARFILNKEEIKARFLAIDTPESVHPTKGVEPYGKEASEYTCNALKNAKKITIEYDPGSDKTDKYKRHLVWVYVDDVLLQKTLIEKGYAKVAYLYGKYQYTEELKEVEEKAKTSKKGIWSQSNNENSKKEESTSKSNATKKTTKKSKNTTSIDKLLTDFCEILEKILDFFTDLVNAMV